MNDIFLPAALADLFVRSALLLLLAWAAATAIGKAGAPAASRHMVWLLCLAALLLLPLLAALLPVLPLPILPTEPPAAASAALAPSLAAAPAPRPLDAQSLLAWTIYGFVAAAVAARLLLGRLMLALHWSRADAHPGLEGRLDQLKSQLGIARRVHLRLSRDSSMPITWGLSEPRILLPAGARSWSEERLRLVLLHELAHVSRFDSPVRLAAGLACALYWFQPVIWFAVRKLRIEQEHAADDLVLAAGARPRVYALSLLEVARGRPSPMMGGLHAAMAGPSELERRLAAIVAPAARGGPGPAFAAATILAASAFALFAATAMPVAAPGAASSVEPVAAARTEVAAPAAAPVAQTDSDSRVASVETAGPSAPAPAGSPLVPPTPVPAIDALPAIPAVAAIAMIPARPAAFEPIGVEADRAEAVAAYRRERAIYRLQLREYHEQLRGFHREVKEQHRQVAALRRDGNLANSGNDGNAGNAGNAGNEGGPGQMPVMPTPPTAPTSPTPPSAIYRRIGSIASAEPRPSSQGP
jgi:beta-lactamase regulating signal transducer with metallopeptidase domain